MDRMKMENLISLLSLIMVFGFSVESSKQDRPNILIILADDFGWGDVSLHGSKQIPTPNIDLLASTGVQLTNYYVQPICSPSRSALLTGLNPIRTGMHHDVIAADQPYGLPLNFTTMGQYFRKLGYQTHLVGKWHQGFFRHEYLPTNRGFDTFFGYWGGHVDYYTRMAYFHYGGYDLQEMDQPANLTRYQGQYSTDMYTDRVVELIHQMAPDLDHHPQQSEKNIGKKPWLMYMAQQSVHTGDKPDILKPPHRHDNDNQHIKDLDRRKFAGMVETLDESIGRVFKALNDSGQLDNTIIVFSTDNGGASGGKNGEHIDNSAGSNWPLKGSKYTLWEGGIHGISWWWSKKLKPRLSNQLMHITDILPTLYSAAGGNLKDLGDIDGMDQWNKLKGETNVKNKDNSDPYELRQDLLHNIDDEFWAVRYRNFKLTNETYEDGNFDYWYVAPGQLTEYPPEDICYNCTETFQILKNFLGKTPKIQKYQIDCNYEKNQKINCKNNELCLFDIENDPCELTNLSEQNPELVEKIFNEIFLKYKKQVIKPVNQPDDPQADPKLHGGFWEPWKD